MTVKQDMQSAIAAAESAQGNYLTFADSTQDQGSKQMFNTMASDMQRHIEQLKGRFNYLQDHNQLNQQKQK